MSRPSDVLKLENWKLTLPVKPASGVDTKKNGDAFEVFPKALAKFADSRCFFVGDDGGVVTQVHHRDLTTKGSKNPRCELREMKGEDSELDFKGRSGTHTLVVEGQVNRLTKKTKTVVLAQVHDQKKPKSDDVTVFRLENKRLYVTDANHSHAHTVTENFKLGTRYTLKIEVKKGEVRYWYNGELVDFTLKVDDVKMYFKAGNYLQSNEDSAPDESKDEFSEVVLYSVTTTHSDDD